MAIRNCARKWSSPARRRVPFATVDCRRGGAAAQANCRVIRAGAPPTASIGRDPAKAGNDCCTNRAKTNWPSEPPALTKPAANERFSAAGAGNHSSRSGIRTSCRRRPPKALMNAEHRYQLAIRNRPNGTSAVPSASIQPAGRRSRVPGRSDRQRRPKKRLREAPGELADRDPPS